MIKKTVTVTCDACKSETIQKEGQEALPFYSWYSVSVIFRHFETQEVTHKAELDLCKLCSDLPYSSLCGLMTDNLSHFSYAHRHEAGRVKEPDEESKGI